MIWGFRKQWRIKFSKPHKVEQNISRSTNHILLPKMSLENEL